jgi:hypothetical protein
MDKNTGRINKDENGFKFEAIIFGTEIIEVQIIS